MVGTERPERGGPCWLLKLRKMGSLGAHMKVVLPWLVRCARRYNGILSCLSCTSKPSTKYYFSHQTLFHFISPHHSAIWALDRQSCWVACLCVSWWGWGRWNKVTSILGPQSINHLYPINPYSIFPWVGGRAMKQGHFHPWPPVN